MDATLTRPRSYRAAVPVLAGGPPHVMVEPVIQTMHACLDRPLSLSELADGAGLSMYHFHRLFRQTTGIAPHEFLTALRLQEAKRLLLTTSLSVTDICYEVGYASLGTFTARFTHLVGASPGRLRRFAETAVLPTMDRLRDMLTVAGSAAWSAGAVAGAIHAPSHLPGPLFVGLFPKPIPQARPIGSAVLTAPEGYHITGLPDGRYHLLAASLPWSENPRVPSLPGPGLLVGANPEPILVQQGRSNRAKVVLLRQPRTTDPPVLSCLPLMLSQRLSRTALSA